MSNLNPKYPKPQIKKNATSQIFGHPSILHDSEVGLVQNPKPYGRVYIPYHLPVAPSQPRTTVLLVLCWMVLTLTWMPWIEFLSGRTCILLWILYGNMVDFSFIVSLYVSNLLNVTTVQLFSLGYTYI